MKISMLKCNVEKIWQFLWPQCASPSLIACESHFFYFFFHEDPVWLFCFVIGSFQEVYTGRMCSSPKISFLFLLSNHIVIDYITFFHPSVSGEL